MEKRFNQIRTICQTHECNDCPLYREGICYSFVKDEELRKLYKETLEIIEEKDLKRLYIWDEKEGWILAKTLEQGQELREEIMSWTLEGERAVRVL